MKSGLIVLFVFSLITALLYLRGNESRVIIGDYFEIAFSKKIPINFYSQITCFDFYTDPHPDGIMICLPKDEEDIEYIRIGLRRYRVYSIEVFPKDSMNLEILVVNQKLFRNDSIPLHWKGIPTVIGNLKITKDNFNTVVISK